MQEELEKRKQKIISFVKSYIHYISLFIILIIGAYIRTRNLPLLKGKYLVELDSDLFYRYAKYIIEHGTLMAHDPMRYVPLGFNTKGESIFLSYLLAYFYKVVHFLIPSLSFEKFDILYPVIFFIFSMIIFFLLIKKLFNLKVACFAAAFLAVLPGFLFRTMAGFADKEPAGIFFMFLTFYCFLSAVNINKKTKSIIYGILSGIFSGLLTAIWGGVGLVFMIIPAFTLISFIFNKFNKNGFYAYTLWLITILISVPLRGLPIEILFSSFTTLFSFFVFLVFLIYFYIIKPDLFKINKILENKLPLNFLSLIISLLLSLAFIFVVSPSLLIQLITEVIESLIHPMGTGRFVLTVAEAHQPYFIHWESNYYHFFYLFFLGSILMFYNFVKPLGKFYQRSLTVIFALFISAFIFSRYSSSSILNGENFISNFLYIGSLIIFVLIMLGVELYAFFKNKEIYNKFKELNTNSIFIFIWFLLTIVGARGAMRLFFIFAPTTAILGAYFIAEVFDFLKNLKIKAPYPLIFSWIFLILVLLAPVNGTFLSLAKVSYNTAKYTGPTTDEQWQKALEWVKTNTHKDSVFAHWWDYGYEVQTFGERATILDGGNAITYWDHLLGRHVLTGHSSDEALEFLKTHNATHLIIVADEIGKFPAYSSIGSDENYDRYSYLPTFMSSPQDIMETRNETLHLFKGQFVLDEDLVYENQIFPRGSAAIVGFIVPIQSISNEVKIEQPTAILVYNGKRYDIPLECFYMEYTEKNYNKSGIKGCLKLVPKYNIATKQIDYYSLGIYISEKVRKTLFAQMYLFNKQWLGFELVYDDTATGWPLVFIENYGRIVGPLKIWKITYPPYIKINPAYLNISYPSEKLSKSNL